MFTVRYLNIPRTSYLPSFRAYSSTYYPGMIIYDIRMAIQPGGALGALVRGITSVKRQMILILKSDTDTNTDTD